MKFVLVVSLIRFLHAIDIYPWGTSEDYLDRSQKILDTIRRNLGLEVEPELISNMEFEGDTETFYINNRENKLFEFDVIKNDRKNMIEEKDALMQYNYDANLLHSMLEGVCAIMPIDYWTYEWCHR
jgi:hypothetical protein